MGLILSEVSKSFGTNKAVDKVSLTLDTPGVYGLLGTNGAGKTTIIRMLLGIINNDSGEITWNDKKVSRETVNFGYLPEERGVYQKIKIRNQLMYFGELKGMKKEDIIASIDKWSKKLKVEQYMNMTADKLSKGNQQKIQFMIAILHNPELVVLDEPFSGLDPVNSELLKNIDEIQNVMLEEKDKFMKTLVNGEREFNKLINRLKNANKDILDSKEIFNLYETYGFPPEVTKDLTLENNFKYDDKGLDDLFKEHQKKSQQGSEQKFKGGLAGNSEIEVKYHTATHLLNAALKVVVSPDCHQKGSNITPERMRFDFVFCIILHYNSRHFSV